jgi:hypothetical protein
MQFAPGAIIAGMAAFPIALVLTALLGAAWVPEASAQPQTVCTITVNSPDEQAMFRRHLPPERFRFVELVERGRPDWLASACSQQIRCDVLVVSGHYDGGNEFFSDSVTRSEYLPVDELERVACSESCPGLFSRLKEVYLFGCNTLDPGAQIIGSAELERSLVRSGHSPRGAERIARALGARHGESSRDRMREIFVDVPAIYGFSSVAPLGPDAAAVLGRYFQAAGAGEVATGRTHARLLAAFAAHSMVVTRGLTAADPQFARRRDVCRLADDRPSTAQKLAFVHELLRREMAEVRLLLDRIEEYVGSVSAIDRQRPDVAGVFAAIAGDAAARARYLDFARDADQPVVRARMLELARDLGWLSPAALRDELVALLSLRLARDAVNAADVDLACSLNERHELEPELPRLRPAPARASSTGHLAILACLGSAEARSRVLAALSISDERGIEAAQVYLRYRPVTEAAELRALSRSIAGMASDAAQVRALEALARLRLADRASLEEIVGLYPRTGSVDVQTAIAGVLIRADYQVLGPADLLRTLRQHRLKSTPGETLIDVLIRQLQAR